ncbi:hypothetical protein H6504_00870 [Candidatus Woesearchaeota archaeon]|nr:hypothetical protein [Candidatus Woesearchaeota archaeon]
MIQHAWFEIMEKEARTTYWESKHELLPEEQLSEELEDDKQQMILADLYNIQVDTWGHIDVQRAATT